MSLWAERRGGGLGGRVFREQEMGERGGGEGKGRRRMGGTGGVGVGG